MYQLLTTHAPDVKDNGLVSFLIWSAMQRADLGLTFDLDGVTTEGIARFPERVREARLGYGSSLRLPGHFTT
jgi:hypothetical protein